MFKSQQRRSPASSTRREVFRRNFRAAIEQLESRSLLAAFTPGNLVIYRVGATGSDLANAGAPVFLDEYTPAGALVQSIAMPTTVNGAQRQLVASGLDVSEGFLTRSGDNRYLTLTGFAANPGTANLSSTTAAAVPRVVGRVDAAGIVDTSTALTDFVSTGTPRTAVSTNGTDIWAGGGASAGNGGMFFTTFGSTTSTNIGMMPMQRRHSAIVDGQLYSSSQGGMGGFSVHTIGVGLPTATGQTSTLLPGLTTTTGLPTTMLSPYAFFFADLSASVAGVDTLYVANDDAQALRKFSLVGGNWSASGSIGVDADDYRGLTGVVSGNTVTLYATRRALSTASGGGELVSIVDPSGYNGSLTATPTLFATAAAQTAFRGVALAPVAAVTNLPPVNAVPGSVLGTEDTDVVFTGMTAVSVSDADAGTNNLTTTISVTSTAFGTFTATANGSTAVVTSSNGGATLTLVGPQSQITLALQTLTFIPAAHRNLSADGTIAVTVNTSDGAASDTDNFNINLNEVNDAPVVVTDSLGELGSEEAGPINIPIATLLSNDSKGAPNESSQLLTLVGVSNPVGGIVAIVGLNVVFMPAANFSGTASFDYTIQDNGTNAGMPFPLSGTGAATLSIGAVNDPPSFVKGADQAVPENAPAQSVSNWATSISAGPNESSQTVSFNVTGNTNGSLFTVGGQPAVSGSGTLTFTPAPGMTGSASITLVAIDDGGTANGGVNVSPPQSFMITVTAAPVNALPMISPISNLSILEGAPQQTINLSGITAGGDVPAQAISVTASSSNSSLVPIVANYTSPNSTGTLIFTSPVNGNGSATITVTVRDSGLDLIAGNMDDGITTRTFLVTVTAVNDVPGFSVGPNQTVNEDAAAQTIAGFATGISAGPNNESSQTLTFYVSSNNPTLFSSAPAIAANGTLNYTLAANSFGSSTVTVTLSDNGGTANSGVDTSAAQTFTITVNPVNDPPAIAILGNQTVPFNAPAQTASGLASVVSVGPANENGQTVSFNITGNTNSALFAAGPSIAADGTLTYTPALGAAGTTTITVVGQDSGGTANGGVDISSPQSFTITISPAVNAPPTINAIGNLTILEGAPLQTISLNGITHGGDVPAQAISVIASSSNASLVPVVVNYTSPNATGIVTFTSPVNGNGSSNVTVTARDSGLDLIPGNSDDAITATSFTVTVTAVNDQPTFTATNPVAINEDAGPQLFTNFITSFSPGPNNENSQTASAYLVANISNSSLFAVPPAVSASGTLTYTPAPNANGSTTFELRVRDSGGTTNGGIDTSAPQTFNITINPVNDAPSFVAGPSQSVNNAASPQTVPNWATGIAAGPADEAGQAVTLQVTGNTNPGLFTSLPAVSAAGTLTYAPALGLSGTATITIVSQDNGGTTNGGVNVSPPQSFTITVLPNQPPVANDSTISAVLNTTVSGTLSATDSDGPSLTFSIVMSPVLGSLTAFNSSTGAFTYSPSPDATGLDLFSFSVTDGTNSDTGMVRIAIQGAQPVITPSNGDLLVIGTPDPDMIIISHVSAGVVRVRTDLASAHYPVTGQLIVNSGQGNDYVVASSIQVPTTLDLGEGDDYASSGPQNDLIIGGSGNDQINASGGDNVIWGDNAGEQDLPSGGNDVLSSLGGNDVMYGDGGNDQLFPGAGNDYVNAGQGDDLVSAGAGDDRVFGGLGADGLFGDEGNDILSGGSGGDQLVGRTGNDFLIGGLGADSLNGDEGNDLFIGGDTATGNSSTSGDANDLALLAMLSTWNASQPAGLAMGIVAGNDGVPDLLQGYTGNDDFYTSVNDSTSDIGLPFMGSDRLFTN